MVFIYTKHTEEKLQRPDIKKFGITKEKIDNAVISPNRFGKTKTGESVAIIYLNEPYILRVIYDKIGTGTKVITFHIAKRRRYGT